MTARAGRLFRMAVSVSCPHPVVGRVDARKNAPAAHGGVGSDAERR